MTISGVEYGKTSPSAIAHLSTTVASFMVGLERQDHACCVLH